MNDSSKLYGFVLTSFYITRPVVLTSFISTNFTIVFDSPLNCDVGDILLFSDNESKVGRYSSTGELIETVDVVKEYHE